MKIATVIILMLISCCVIGQDETTPHNHGSVNYAGLEDEFAHVAPTHVKEGNQILDAYGVKLLMQTPKKKIWYGHYYVDSLKTLFIGYKFTEEIPDMTSGWNWREIDQLDNTYNIVEMKKYGGILWLFGLEQIVNHVIILPSDKDSDGQVYVSDVFVFMFTDPAKYDQFKKFKDRNKNENGFQKMMLHEGRIHFPTGG